MKSTRVLLICGLMFWGAARVFAQAPSAPPSDAQLTSLGKAIEKSVAAADVAAFVKQFDSEQFVHRVVDRVPANENFRKGAYDAMLEQFRGGSFPTEIKQSLGRHGTYQFRRIIDGPEGKRLLFRMESPAGANYHEYLIAMSPGGDPKAIDIDVAITGELITQSMQRLYAKAAMDHEKPSAQAITGKNVIDAINSMSADMKNKKYKELLATYDALPDRVKKEKVVQIVRMQAAIHVGIEQYKQANDDFQMQFGDDPSAAFIAVDGLTVNGKYDEALAAIDHLEKIYGPDAYMDVLRCNVLTRAGKFSEAQQASQRAVDAEPDTYFAHNSLLTIAAKTSSWDVVVQQFDAIERQFGVKFNIDLNNAKSFDDFKKTTQYQDWRKRHAPAPESRD